MMRPARLTAHCRTDCVLAYVHPAHHPPLLPLSSTLIGGSSTSIIFVATKHVFCLDKRMLVATKRICFLDKHVFVATKMVLVAASANNIPTAVSRTSTSNAVLTVTLRPRCVTHGQVPARVSVMYMIMIGDYQSFPLRVVCIVAVTSHPDYQSFPLRVVCIVAVTSHPHTSSAQAATSHRK